MKFDINDINLADVGLRRIEWAMRRMQTLATVGKELIKDKAFSGINISACLHVTSETANLVIVLNKAGAQIMLCASNPLSTQDDVAAALVKYFKIPVFAKKGEDSSIYYSHIKEVLSYEPQITMDDGADLVSTLHKEFPNLSNSIIGGTEETTTGVLRLKQMQAEGILKYPIIAVNNSKTKFLFDNRYGTGQSTIDGILRATNMLLAGKIVVVCGYGWCGRGIAMRARGLGAEVIITEIDPIKALEAKLDGYSVMKMDEAAKIGDIFITATGNCNIINKDHILKMKGGVVLANAGHFNVEIDVAGLESITAEKRQLKEHVTEYELKDSKTVILIAEGRLVNLAAAEGHPPEVMDLSFAIQAQAVLFLLENKQRLKNIVYELPEDLDKKIALIKLNTLGVEIDSLTEEQKKYLSTWQEGT